MIAHAQADQRQRLIAKTVAGRTKPRFDRVDYRGRLGEPAVCHQPARGFRNPKPHEKDDEPEHRANQEGETPAEFLVHHRGIEQNDRSQGADRSADPEAAVDDEIGPPAIARGHELLDGGIDRGVFAADAHAGQEAEEQEAPQVPGQSGGGGCGEIDQDGDGEELLAAKPVGEPAEEQRAQDSAREIGAARQPDVGVGELQLLAGLQRRRYGARQRHLEAVEHPGDAERDYDQCVETAPPQPVEPRRNVGLDDRGGHLFFLVLLLGRHCHFGLLSPSRIGWQGNDLAGAAFRTSTREPAATGP